MIAVIKQGTEQKQIDNLIQWLNTQGVSTHISNGEYSTVLGLIGDTSRIDIELLESYIADHLGGVIADEYALPKGRIVLPNSALRI